MDCFVQHGMMVLWCKDEGTDLFFEERFRPSVYFETFNERFARCVLRDLEVVTMRRKHMDKGEIDVLKVTFRSLIDYKNRFRAFEKRLRDVGWFHDADIPVEEMFLFERGLFPLCTVDEHLCLKDDAETLEYELPSLRIAMIRILEDGVELNGRLFTPAAFKDAYEQMDPDIIVIDRQQRELLSLAERMGIMLNRRGKEPRAREGGYSYVSYGTASYREYPISLKGRLLINSSSFMDESFTVFSLLEGARVCRMTVQRLASHSVGAAITNLLSWQARNDGYLVPYKSGFSEKIRPFRNLVECDRGALTFEPLVGMHTDVAELDFVSMFPSIIARYNLSPDTFDCSCCGDEVFRTGMHFCQKKTGVVPQVCAFLMRRRAHFKQKRDCVSAAKAGYLKWLLVVIFGFQGCTHKKIGRIEVHEAINAIARETLLAAVKVAERSGYTVLHGIVDSLYVTCKRMEKKGLIRLAQDISEECGIAIELKDRYRFMVFLPSVNAEYMPVPTSYYGVSMQGEVKVRGIALRQRSAPRVVKNLQQEIIEDARGIRTDDDVRGWLRRSVSILRNHLDSLPSAVPDDLAFTVRIGRERYKVRCPQQALAEKRVAKLGQSIRYVVLAGREYREVSEAGVYDHKTYTGHLKKALLHLFLPFGLTRDGLERMLEQEVQRMLTWYLPRDEGFTEVPVTKLHRQ